MTKENFLNFRRV